MGIDLATSIKQSYSKIRIKNVVLNSLLYSKGWNGFNLQLHDATLWGAHFGLVKWLATGHGFRLDCLWGNLVDWSGRILD